MAGHYESDIKKAKPKTLTLDVHQALQTLQRALREQAEADEEHRAAAKVMRRTTIEASNRRRSKAKFQVDQARSALDALLLDGDAV